MKTNSKVSKNRMLSWRRWPSLDLSGSVGRLDSLRVTALCKDYAQKEMFPSLLTPGQETASNQHPVKICTVLSAYSARGVIELGI